jgi:hypothetical protein
MVRLNHFTLERQKSTTLRQDSQELEKEDNGQSVSDVTDDSTNERPIPDILMIMKSKILKLGQISVHLLSSPFGNEMNHDAEKYSNYEFPYTFPPIKHLSTLLCIGNPDIPTASSFELCISQSNEDDRVFEFKTSVPCIECIMDPLQI